LHGYMGSGAPGRCRGGFVPGPGLGRGFWRSARRACACACREPLQCTTRGHWGHPVMAAGKMQAGQERAPATGRTCSRSPAGRLERAGRDRPLGRLDER
jgi:hypothetical protein